MSVFGDEFIPERFSPGDSPTKLFSANLLNWIIESLAKRIRTGDQLEFSKTKSGFVFTLSDRILRFKIVQLNQTLQAFGTAQAKEIRITEADGIQPDASLIITVKDICGTQAVSGTRGFALECELSDDLRWIFFGCSGLGGSPSFSSSQQGTSGFHNCLPCNISLIPGYEANKQLTLRYDPVIGWHFIALGPSKITVGCCSNPISRRLRVTGISGNLNGYTFIATYNDLTREWETPIEIPGDHTSQVVFKFRCDSDSFSPDLWRFSTLYSGNQSSWATFDGPNSCSPFELKSANSVLNKNGSAQGKVSVFDDL